jgi:hypothetical protein
LFIIKESGAMLADEVTRTEGWVIVVVAFLGFCGTFVTAVFAFLGLQHAREAKNQATQANDAVNHAHESGQDRLFDMVVETRQRGKETQADVKEINVWKERWDGLPEELSTASKLTTHFEIIEDRIKTSGDSLHRSLSELDKQNTFQHNAIVKKLEDHIQDEAPKIAALADSLSKMETRTEAGDRTDDAVTHIEENAQQREDRNESV